jgi:hypothetical protein
MRRTTTLTLVSALALLAACSKPATSTSAPGGEAAAPKPANPVAVFTRPHPKAGLWQMTMSTDAGPGVKMSGEICLDEKTENAAFEAGPKAKSSNCQEPRFSANPGGGMVFETVCKVGERSITSKGVATGDFSSSYAVDVTAIMDPPLPGNMGTTHTRMESHYIGPCKEGQTPGRMLGMKLAGVGRG